MLWVSRSTRSTVGNIERPEVRLLTHSTETLPVIRWKDKTIDKAVWRGSFTGAFHSDDFDWQNSQRERLVMLASSTDEQLEEVLVQGWKGVGRKQYPRAGLNERYLDIAPVGGPVQVSVKRS
jgi:hypothetical protein